MGKRGRLRSGEYWRVLKTLVALASVLSFGSILAPGARALATAPPLPTPNLVLFPNTCLIDLCIQVDTSHQVEPAAHQASGILHSMNGTGIDGLRLAQLGVSMWRSSTNDWSGTVAPWNTAVRQHVPVTFLLSDKWLSDTRGGRIAPWSNWNNYGHWVGSSVRQIQQVGIHVDYWEIYNEPDYSLPPAEASTATPDRLLTQFRVAYDAIRGILPDAQIIGPSTSGWIERPTAHSFSMTQFLDFAAANRLSLAALNWHYNNPDPGGIETQVAEARNLLATRHQLGNPMIFINEYGTQDTQRIPGWDVRYLAALTNARVDSAGRSCWRTDCSAPVLDGLLAGDGSSTLPDFWVRALYNQMSGDMVAASSNISNVGVVASVDGARSRVQVLLGYGQGCVQDPRCAADDPWAIRWPSVPANLIVRVPWTSGMVAVTKTRIPGSSISPISQPTSDYLGTFAIRRQTDGAFVAINLGSIADGDAWSFSITRTH